MRVIGQTESDMFHSCAPFLPLLSGILRNTCALGERRMDGDQRWAAGEPSGRGRIKGLR